MNTWTKFKIVTAVIFAALLCAKLTGLITASWWLVFAPAIVFALVCAIFLTAIEMWFLNR